MMMIIVIIYI